MTVVGPTTARSRRAGRPSTRVDPEGPLVSDRYRVVQQWLEVRRQGACAGRKIQMAAGSFPARSAAHPGRPNASAAMGLADPIGLVPMQRRCALGRLAVVRGLLESVRDLDQSSLTPRAAQNVHSDGYPERGR